MPSSSRAASRSAGWSCWSWRLARQALARSMRSVRSRFGGCRRWLITWRCPGSCRWRSCCARGPSTPRSRRTGRPALRCSARAAALAGRRLPVYVAAHGKEWIQRPLAQRAVRATLCTIGCAPAHCWCAEGLFPVSRRSAELLRAAGAPAARITVVHNGVDAVRFRPQRADALRSELAGSGPLLLSVARLVRRKGIDTVLRALPKLLAAMPTLTYAIVGDGPDRARLAALSGALGVRAHVRFLAHVAHDLVDYYNACDLFVLPAREEPGDIEGFGLVFLEASACQKPVIGARAGGVVDAIEDGVTGLLVPPDDGEALAHARSMRCCAIANARRRWAAQDVNACCARAAGSAPRRRCCARCTAAERHVTWAGSAPGCDARTRWQVSGRVLRGGHVVQLAYLALPFADDRQEALGPFERFGLRLDLEQGEPGDQLLRLRKRAVGHGELARVDAHARPSSWACNLRLPATRRLSTCPRSACPWWLAPARWEVHRSRGCRACKYTDIASSWLLPNRVCEASPRPYSRQSRPGEIDTIGDFSGSAPRGAVC